MTEHRMPNQLRGAVKIGFLIVAAATAMTLSGGAGDTGPAFAAKFTIPKAPVTGVFKQGPGPPHYRFTIESFKILDTRADNNDTDYVSAGLTGLPNQVKDMGDVNNGTHQVGITFEEGVAPLNTVTLSYVILNSGKSADVLGKFFGNFAFNVGALFGENWGGILAGGCDGMVAQGQHSFSGNQLAAGTAGGQFLSGNDYTAGSDSAVGCGSNSRYYVQWTVKAVQ